MDVSFIVMAIHKNGLLCKDVVPILKSEGPMFIGPFSPQKRGGVKHSRGHPERISDF